MLTEEEKQKMKSEGLTDAAIKEIENHPVEWKAAGEWVEKNVLSNSNEESSKFQVMGD